MDALQNRSGMLPGWGRRLAERVPTALVLLSLAGIALWGYRSDWKFRRPLTPASESRQPDIDWCGQHGVSKSDCLNCRNPLRPVVQFATAREFESAGIEIDVVGIQDVVESLNAAGEVAFDPSRTAHLTSRAAGTIWRVRKRLGDRVQAGDVLLLVDAHEVGKAKSEFLQSISNMRLKQGVVDRLAPLAETGAAPARQLIEADAALHAAEIRLMAAQESLSNLGLPVRAGQFARTPVKDVLSELKFQGIPRDEVSELDRETASSNLIPVRSPIGGVVVAADAVIGEVVATTTPLFTIAERNRLWVTLEIPQKEIRKIRLGQKLRFRPDGVDQELEGEVQWIADSVDERTRTLKVRAEAANDSLQIKSGSFGAGRIILREAAQAIVVPKAAVHSHRGIQIVFVRSRDFLRSDSPKYFEIRPVQPGVAAGEQVEIQEGLKSEDVIATTGSDRLLAMVVRQRTFRSASNAGRP